MHREIPGAVCASPVVILPLLPKLPIRDAEEFAIFMLESSSSTRDGDGAPADGFYATGQGQGEVRIAYVINCDDWRRP